MEVPLCISPHGDSGAAPPHLPSLRNSIFHDASHVSNGEIDVLFPEVLLDAAVIVVVQTLLSIVCTQQAGFLSVQSEP